MGERFGPYRDLRRIAVGGSGEVFEARDPRTGVTVALKLSLPRPGARAEDLLTEARLQERIVHPNLVKVLAHGIIEGQPYIALEYVDGPSLAEVLATRKLSGGTAVEVARQILAALAAIHAATDGAGAPLHVVHRDVTPQNIMFDRHGVVKLGDLGIARVRIADRTRTGVIKGKLGYLAPEQVTQSAVDARTDLYQVGLVLFEMLCGVPYFDAADELGMLHAASAPAVKRPSAFGGPHVLDAIVARALERFPEQRYATADSFANDLARVAPNLDAQDFSFVGEVKPATPQQRPGSVSRRRMPKVALVALALSLTCGIAFAFYDRAAPRAVEPKAPPQEPAVTAVVTPSPVAATTPGVPEAVSPSLASKRPRKAAAPPVVAAPTPPDAQDALAAPAPATTPTVAECVGSLRSRGIEVADLASTLRDEVARASARDDALCAKLAAVQVDRPLVERKLARLQRGIDALATDDPRRPEVERLSRETLHTLLDGNVPRTHAKLQALEGLLAPRGDAPRAGR